MYRLCRNGGYTLIELVIVILILAVLATVTLQTLQGANDVARTEETKRELDQLAWAVAGQPDLTSGGTRTDFGYVGDVGAMPANLDALVQNPGGYATWNGPYIRDDFYAAAAAPETEFRTDAWGVPYGFSGNVTITSTGSGTAITRQVAPTVADLLYNHLNLVVTDLDQDAPGSVFKDSLRWVLTHPDGAGSLISRTRTPRVDGSAQFDSIPIGNHQLLLVDIPQNDTITRRIIINPGTDTYSTVTLPEDLF